jgi:cell division protein FtsB
VSKSALKSLFSISLHQRWFIFFGLWLLLLSGLLANFVGSPGATQAIRLNNLLTAKRQQVASAQEELQKLQKEATRLEVSRVAQEKEIRKVLGYAASDEIIFDFN